MNYADPFGLYADRQDETANEHEGGGDCRPGYVWAKDIGECVNIEEGKSYSPEKEAQAKRLAEELERINAACSNAAVDAAVAAGTDLSFFLMGAAGVGAKATAAFAWGTGVVSGPDLLSAIPIFNFGRAYRQQLRACRGLTP